MSNTSAPPVFANTILVPHAAGQTPILQTVGATDQARKKRPHFKSRRGCVACKRRKVKVRHCSVPLKTALTTQCDERLPCSSCVKRNIQCLPPSHLHVLGPRLSTHSAHFEMDMNPHISLLHLELFHHWDKETRSTLAFPQVWPVVMQRAFHVYLLYSWQ
jgi:hypothetical protein